MRVVILARNWFVSNSLLFFALKEDYEEKDGYSIRSKSAFVIMPITVPFLETRTAE